MSERNVGGFFQKDADAIFKPMGVSNGSSTGVEKPG
jgi:hypothetical protein